MPIQKAVRLCRRKRFLFRRLAVPIHGLRLVLGNTVAIAEAIAEFPLRASEPLFRRLAIPLHGLRVVLGNTLAIIEAVPEAVLRGSEAGSGLYCVL